MYDECLYPRTLGDLTQLKYGSSPDCQQQRCNNILTLDLRSDLRLFAASPEFGLAGTWASDEPTIYSGTPLTGNTNMKSTIRAHGTNSNGRSQLGFLVSNDAAFSVHTVNSDVSMLIGHQKVSTMPRGINPRGP